MDNLTNIIEAILFASGKSVAVADIAEKLGLKEKEVRAAAAELKARYGEAGGICLLEFNDKLQLATNPAYKDNVYSVLNPIREKELTRTILECAAIIAYKQPVTRTEIEMLRGVDSNYAVNALLELKLIAPCGRKDAVGHPVLFATTDEFLKRFGLSSLNELPDYDELIERITRREERDSYLYARDEYRPEGEEAPEIPDTPERKREERERVEDGFEIPDFLSDSEDVVKIS